QDIRTVRTSAACARRWRRPRPGDLAADRRGARRPAHRPIRARARIHIYIHCPSVRRGAGMKVLIIDDEPHIRQMMRLTLEAAGYQGDEAATGEGGPAPYDQHGATGRPGGPGSYDAVLLDQKMPGIDGLQTLKQLKA